MLKGKTLVEYEDGTEFTTSDYALSVALGATACALYYGSKALVKKAREGRLSRKLNDH